MKLTIHVRVSRKKRNKAGWWLVIGSDRHFYKHKPDAIKEAKRLASLLRLSIEPHEPIQTQVRDAHWLMSKEAK